MASVKGLTAGSAQDGAGLRILIVHARWNMTIIEPLIAGARAELKAAGVRDENVVVEDVSGSYELPFACARMIAASQTQAASTEPDIMGAGSLLDLADPSKPAPAPARNPTRLTGPFSAVIAIGVLIKGSTMHFEYICDAVSHGLMRVQLDTAVPVIFGVLTCLTEKQALERSGQTPNGHNHGSDWGRAAVECAVKNARWTSGAL